MSEMKCGCCGASLETGSFYDRDLQMDVCQTCRDFMRVAEVVQDAARRAGCYEEEE